MDLADPRKGKDNSDPRQGLCGGSGQQVTAARPAQLQCSSQSPAHQYPQRLAFISTVRQ